MSLSSKNIRYQLRYRAPLGVWIAIVFITIVFSSTTFSAGRKNIPGNDSTIVERFGLIKAAGNKLVDKNGNPVVLRGMCLYWSQWKGQFYNYDCINWLRDDWKCTVVRASMGVESGGYLTDPSAEKAKIKTVIDACIDLGIYVIVDWHDHHGQWHTSQAIAFFEDIASEYGDKPNLIYEIYNEPLQVSWSDSIKPYADSVAKHIRAIDPDNLIIVGSSTWSQDVDVAANNPLAYGNIAYSLHFYAATHKQSLRNKATTALNKGVALFVSEFGTSEASGTGKLDSAEVEVWMKFMNDNKLSWCNWSIADLTETSAALKPGASGNGGWSDANLSTSGLLIRGKIRSGYDSLITGIVFEADLPLNFELHQNYPNPFNPSTTIEYVLNENGHVKLEIFDVTGRRINSLINDYETAGRHTITWNGNADRGMKTSSGIYFYQCTFQNYRQIKKAIFLQ
jgi:endoglucanase